MVEVKRIGVMTMKRLVLSALFTSWGLLALSTTACEKVWRSLAARNEKDQEAWLQDALAAEVRLTETGRAAETELSQLLERAAIVPGVKEVAVVDVLPGAVAQRHRIPIEREGYPPDRRLAGYLQVVSPRYFTTMKLALIQGRSFAPNDVEGSPLVAMVNESYARPKNGSGYETPLGKRVRIGGAEPWLTIVGVVKDGPRVQNHVEVYVPLAQQAASGPQATTWYVLARVAGDREVVATLLQKRLGREFRTLEESLKAHEPHDS